MTVPSRGEPYGSVDHEDDGGSPRPTGHPAGDRHALTAEAAAGINRLEGYLLAQRARDEAAEAGLAFARRLPWLGAREEAEAARLFEQEYLALRRRMLQATVARAEELREEYGRRYALLRRRLVATALGLGGALSAVLAVVVRGVG
ncbi:hypothetical protein [Streptomyces roseoviridis]|uniref:Cytochrome C oxidase subunit I n=1 Tax=Streptomyces roseoviridis TaxID=67361 RepID=A0ABV5QTE4_9ACTN